jgi:hypothetical protein
MDERIFVVTFAEHCVQAGQRSNKVAEEVVFDDYGYARWVSRGEGGEIGLRIPTGENDEETPDGFIRRPATEKDVADIEWAVLDDNGRCNDDYDVHIFANRAALETEIAWRREHANIGQYDRAVTASMVEML